MSLENALTKEEVVPQLWLEYQRDPEFIAGGVNAIRRDHPIIRKREEQGLMMVISRYVRKAATEKNVSPTELENEIKTMHKLLFKYVFKKTGKYRKEERRIGDYYDDVLKLSPANQIPGKIADYVGWLSRITNFPESYIDKCYLLADIHLKIILIHPFSDGNGRIARAIADKYAVKMGLPPVLDSYPRVNKDQQKTYHDAIYKAKKNSDLESMAMWIKGYVDKILEQLA